METPIKLPDDWAAETDEMLGVIITAVDPSGHKAFITINEQKRSFELGMSMVRQRGHYSGRFWRKELYEEAVAALKKAIC